MAMREDFVIKHAGAQDADILFRLIQQMALSEGRVGELTTTPQQVRDTICNGSAASAYLGYYNGSPVAYVIYCYTYPPILGTKCLYLEEMFIKPIYQRLGLGRKIVEFMAKLALNTDCLCMDWNCSHTNTNAIKFYEHIGTNNTNTRRHFHMNHEQLSDFAETCGAEE